MQCKQRCVMICSLSEHVLLWHGTGDLRKNRRKRWLSKTGHLATSMWCLSITKAGKAHNARTRQVPAAAKLCCYGCWGFIHFFSLKGWSVDINEKTRTRSSNPSHSTVKSRNMQNRSKQYLFISFHFISFLCLSWDSWSFVFSLHLSSWLELKINHILPFGLPKMQKTMWGPLQLGLPVVSAESLKALFFSAPKKLGFNWTMCFFLWDEIKAFVGYTGEPWIFTILENQRS